jgi:hypothetical protein
VGLGAALLLRPHGAKATLDFTVQDFYELERANGMEELVRRHWDAMAKWIASTA